jgi:hypothetical protein
MFSFDEEGARESSGKELSLNRYRLDHLSHKYNDLNLPTITRTTQTRLN